MKRLDLATNEQYEVLFTEAAYDALCHDANYLDKVTIRLKTNYKSFENNWDKVFLMRALTERNLNTLTYHPESWYQCKDSIESYHKSKGSLS